jgi:hypothetical protein
LSPYHPSISLFLRHSPRLWYNRRTLTPYSAIMHQPMKLLRHIFHFAILAGLLTACGSALPPEPTPTATPRPTATATPRPTPTVTPVPLCPSPNLAADWAAPNQFDGYPEAIRAYLSQGGAAANLLTILRNASSINEKWGGVSSIDLTGDGEPEIVVSIFDPFTADQAAGPSGQLLVYGCAPQRIDLLYANQAPKGQTMPRLLQSGDLIGTPRGTQLTVVSSSCGANTCFDRLEVLGWNGIALINLLAEPLDLPAAQYQLVQADADNALEIQAQRGRQGSIGAGPQRTEKQLWDWNGAQYVKVKSEWSPVEYRIHAVYEGDDAFAAGDYAKATDWYIRVLTDDTLKDWLTEIGYTNAHDRDTLQAYARFRLLLIGLLRGDANARDQLDQLTALYPEGSPVHLTQQMAQAFWDKYQETQDIKAACAVANAYANSSDNGQYLIVDDLNLFGYTNRSYTSDDMCPIQ